MNGIIAKKNVCMQVKILNLEINEVINGNNEVITGNQNGNTIITKKGNSISELKNSEGNKKVIQGNKERNKLHSIKGNNEVIKGNPFTDYEVMALKEIVKHWRKGELEASASLETSHDIRELDLPLDIGNKVRKTFHISEEYIHKIDEFAKQNRFSKSDVLHLALFDFFSKQGPLWPSEKGLKSDWLLGYINK